MATGDGNQHAELLTVKAAARRLDLSVRTLWRHIGQGHLDGCLIRPPYDPDPRRKGARRRHRRLIRVNWPALLTVWGRF